MAKKPIETQDRYRLHAETSTEQFGMVLAQLTRMGLENIGYELITDVTTFRSNKRPNGKNTTAEQEITEFIKEFPTFRAAELVTHLAPQGRQASSLYQALGLMVQKKLLRKLQPGVYQDVNIGHLPAPAEAKAPSAAKPKRRPPGHHPRLAVSNRDFIVKWIGRKTKFEISALTQAFKDEGRNPSSASSVITQMGHDGAFKNLGDGVWEVIKLPQLRGNGKSPAKASLNAATTGADHHG